MQYSLNMESGDSRANEDLAVKILDLRDRLAMAGGFSCYAAGALANSMPGSHVKVREFLESAAEKWRSAAVGVAWIGSRVSPIYEFGAVHEKLREVIAGNFNLELVAASDRYPAWHPDVAAYEVRNRETGAVTGLLYVDCYSRESKTSHSGWATHMRRRALYGSREEIPIAVINCNFKKSGRGRKNYLSFDEAKTLFHEAGHALQFLLTEGRYPSLSVCPGGTEYAEIFSIMVENIFSRPETWEPLAIDPRTKERASEDCLWEEREQREYLTINHHLFTIEIARIDQALNSVDPSRFSSLDGLTGWAARETGAREIDVFNRLRSSRHMFSDMFSAAAGYYGYEWAAAAAATAEQAIGDDKVRLRELFAAAAGPPVETFRRIVGRDVDPDAPFRKAADARPRGGISFDLGKVGRGRIIEITTP